MLVFRRYIYLCWNISDRYSIAMLEQGVATNTRSFYNLINKD